MSSPATTLVSISDLAAEPNVVAAGQDRVIHERPGVAVRMLTSGTTGPPKRVDLTYDMLAHSVMGPEDDQAPAPTELRRGVAIVNSPLVHIGGVFRILQCVAEARPFVLLERFELDRWAEAVRAHRPRAVSLVPTALRMVLALEPDPGGSGQHPRGDLGHRPVIARTILTRSPRSTGFRC